MNEDASSTGREAVLVVTRFTTERIDIYRNWRDSLIGQHMSPNSCGSILSREMGNESTLLKGLRVIWESVSWSQIVLFIVLCAASLLLLTPLPGDTKLLVVSSVVGGVVYFFLLTLMALIPPLWRAFGILMHSQLGRLALFASTCAFVYLFLLPSFVIVVVGALGWLINLSIISCILPYLVSTKLSRHGPRVLGWIFFAFAAIVNALVYIFISQIPLLAPLLDLYVLAWLTPCVLIAFARYGNRTVFAAYMLIALVYSLYPVGYRLYSLLSELLGSPGGTGALLSSRLLEEGITVAMFVWALNSVGRLASNEYRLFKEGREKLKDKITSPLRRLRREEEDSELVALSSAASLFDQFKREELAVNPALIFGLLFSALAYFAFRHGSASYGIPEWVAPGVALILSMMVTIPLLFYMVMRKRQRHTAKAGVG
jgi:hypothetical protein